MLVFASQEAFELFARNNMPSQVFVVLKQIRFLHTDFFLYSFLVSGRLYVSGRISLVKD